MELGANASFVSATQTITHSLIEQQWGTLLMLHAGAVADPASGRALAYVAPGGTGKSTLTRLLAQTLGYVTDETVGVVPATLEVLPYPKPLTWADEKGKPKREHAPEDVGLGATPERVELARLAVLRRRDGAEATFTPLGLLDAVEMVVPETSSLSKLPAPLQTFADVYERVGGVTLIEYGEAEDIVEWCRQSLTELPSLVEPASAASGVETSEASPTPEPQPADTSPGFDTTAPLASSGAVGSTSGGRDSGAGSAAGAPSIRSFVPHEHSGQRLRRSLARKLAGERSGTNTPGERSRTNTAGERSRADVSEEVVDFLAVGDESVALVGDGLLRLGPIATAIVELLPSSVEELATQLEERFGAPAEGDLHAAVEEQLKILAEHGVIERGV